ncbi:hypothetical protein FRC01_009980 [Tulasnella sp. 417]|nr:hypothetical protein FRC01_009980 [Tulasnella sp. 417]
MSIEAAREIFDIFIRDDLPEVMLFLKHVTAIEVSEISPNGKQTLLAAAKVENAREIVAERSKTRGRSPVSGTSHYRLVLTKTHNSGSKPTSKRGEWVISHYVESFRNAASAMAMRLNRTNDLNGVETSMISDKLFPHVALALPLLDKDAPAKQGFSGRLFTLLPLPIFTHFPLHIHAALALTPSRQNLRNAQETVTDPKSRLRVEWNRIIFARFVPKAWVSLMSYLIATPQGIDVFDTWPSSKDIRADGYGYWPAFPHVLLKEAAAQEVWTLRSEPSSHKRLGDVLVATTALNLTLMSALEFCGVPVVIVSSNVLEIIAESEFKGFILQPVTAISFLRGNNERLPQLERTPARALCDYLVSAKDFNLLTQLQILPNVTGGHTSISPNVTYTLASSAEAEVFGSLTPEMLDVEAMSDKTRELLIRGSGGRVHHLGSKDIVVYLQSILGKIGEAGASTVVKTADKSLITWLVAFWAWMDTWKKLDDLVADKNSWSAIQNMHALPLCMTDDQPALQLVRNAAIRPAQIDNNVLFALLNIGVPILHLSISDGRAIEMVSKKPDDAVFVLQNVSGKDSIRNLSQTDRETLHEFFINSLTDVTTPLPVKPSSLRSRFGNMLRRPDSPSLPPRRSVSPSPPLRVQLDKACQKALRTLPVFPLLRPGKRNADIVFFDNAPDGSHFVSQSVQVIPNIDGIAFFDSDKAKQLRLALEVEEVNEVTVLNMVIKKEAWTQLHPEILPDMIGRLISCLPDFTQTTRQQISELDIVDVNSSGRRKSPKGLIDPSSPLTELFDPADEIIPVGEFAKKGKGSHLELLRSHHMLQTALTEGILEERIAHIVKVSQGPNPDAATMKALRLLSLLDGRGKERYWTGLSSPIVKVIRDATWIPVENKFYRPSDCWDSRPRDASLCDRVLPRVKVEISSPIVRASLGWDVIPFDVLRRQLMALTDVRPESQAVGAENISDSIRAILKELASRFRSGQCDRDELGQLADQLQDKDWVPVSEDRQIKARLSWQPSDASAKPLASRFFPVSALLLKHDGMRALLTCMRIPKCPSTAELYSSQENISKELSQSGLDSSSREVLIRAAIDIALEIRHHRENYGIRQFPVLVPSESGTLIRSEDVLFNDAGLVSGRPLEGTQFAHPLISQKLARDLGLRTYRELQLIQLGSVEDDGGLSVQEDFSTRIKSGLLDYDIDHSIHEWVASASDAQASVLNLLVDEAIFNGSQCIPTKQEFPTGPALVIHHNGVLSDEDFQTIRSFGTSGGKTEGLSIYHFTELPMIISGSSVVILDPSRKYLLLEKSCGIRLALDICYKYVEFEEMRNERLTTITSRNWPNQLKPLHGIFGFDLGKGHYKGTLFRLPLRTATQAESSRLSSKQFTALDAFGVIRRFYTSASRSLFFAPLHEISAQRRTANPALSRIWHVTGSRKTIRRENVLNLFTAKEIDMHLRNPEKQDIRQRWLVATSKISRKAFPLELESLVDIHWLSNSEFNLGLAFNLSAQEYIPSSTLFSTFPLPASVRLPVHLYAPWILAQDHRSISTDASIEGGKPSPNGQYNRYIMQHFLPTLYLQTLELLNKEYPDSVKLAWPRRSNGDGEDLVATVLYRQLTTTPRLVLRSANGRRVSPAAAMINFQRNPQVVQKILKRLPIWNYVSEPHFDMTFSGDWGTLHDVSARGVADALRASVEQVHRLCSGDPPQIGLKDVEDILGYLLEAKESLVGIPLLPLGTGNIVVFGSSQDKIVLASHFDFVERFFGKHRMINPNISPLLSKTISDPLSSLNIRQLTPDSLRQLLTELDDPITIAECRKVAKDKLQWHKKLFAFLVKEWQSDELQQLADLPLIPTENGELLVSLAYAKGRKIWRKYSWEKPCLSSVFLQLEIPIVSVQIIGGTSLPEVTEQQQLLDVLGVLQHAGIAIPSIPESVKQDDWAEFAAIIRNWIRVVDLDGIFENTELAGVLVNLPLFRGWQCSGSLPYVPSSNLMMLPMPESLEALAPFLPQNSIFAPRTPELESILSRHEPGRIVSLQQVFGPTNLPGSQTEEPLHPGMKAAMNMMLSSYKVPSQSKELHDHFAQVSALPSNSSHQDQDYHSERIFAKWRDLRAKRESFDIFFKPKGYVIGAHLGILSAVVPNFVEFLTGSFRQSTALGPTSGIIEYPLPDGTSSFAVNSALDYVYNGSFVHPVPATSEDESWALDQLLDLLRLADSWKIAELKDQIVSRISEFGLVNKNNCAFVTQKAEAYNSEALVNYCAETKKLTSENSSNSSQGSRLLPWLPEPKRVFRVFRSNRGLASLGKST